MLTNGVFIRGVHGRMSMEENHRKDVDGRCLRRGVRKDVHERMEMREGLQLSLAALIRFSYLGKARVHR